MDPRQIELIEGFLDDSLDAGRLQELLGLVRSDEAFKSEFRSALRMRGLVEGALHADSECDQLADAVRKAIGPDHEGGSFESRVMARIEAPQAEEKTRKPTRHWLRKARRRDLSGSGPGFFIAAALLLAFVGLIALSTSSPAPQPSPKLAERERPSFKPERDWVKFDEDLRKREEKALREQEERERLERERLDAQAMLDQLEKQRKGQEEARRLAVEQQKEADRIKAEETLRLIRAEEQKAKQELKKNQETQRRIESLVTTKVIAHVTDVQGKVFLGEGTTRTPAEAGAPIVSGQAIETEGRDGRVILRFLDKTRVELLGDTKLREVADREKEGKRLHLLQGTLTAGVEKQPMGRPMIIGSPQANAQVLGTTLRLIVDAGETRLEVTKGIVKLTRLDGKSASVTAGQYAVASEGAEPAAKALPKVLLAETFEDPRTVDKRWRLLFVGRDVSAALRDGKLDFSLLSSSTQNNTQGEVHSRQPFAPSVRVSMDVEFSHLHPDLLAGFTFVPMESEPRRDNKDAILFTRAGGRRSFNLGLGKWGWKGIQPPATIAAAPLKEQWVMELDGEEARLLVDEKEVFRKTHGGKVHPGYYLRLEGTALTGPSLPLGAFVRYDNVRVEQLGK